MKEIIIKGTKAEFFFLQAKLRERGFCLEKEETFLFDGYRKRALK
jgi:hypothetical protein